MGSNPTPSGRILQIWKRPSRTARKVFAMRPSSPGPAKFRRKLRRLFPPEQLDDMMRASAKARHGQIAIAKDGMGQARHRIRANIGG